MNNRSRQQGKTFTSLRPAQNGEPGFSLIEILVALGILAAVAVIFLIGMSTSSRAVIVSQERVAIDSLAKSEMEYVKSVSYKDASWSYELPSNPPPPSWWTPQRTLPDGYSGYSVKVTASPLHDTDDGIQKIKVEVKRGGKTFTLVGYNVK
jgi:prepilin-type N-terminal cleavage/methylation domain-containing protein